MKRMNVSLAHTCSFSPEVTQCWYQVISLMQTLSHCYYKSFHAFISFEICFAALTCRLPRVMEQILIYFTAVYISVILWLYALMFERIWQEIQKRTESLKEVSGPVGDRLVWDSHVFLLTFVSCFRSRSSSELWKYLIRHSLWSHQAGGAWRFAGSWVCSGTCPRPDRWSSAALDCPTRWALCRRTDARFCPKRRKQFLQSAVAKGKCTCCSWILSQLTGW